MGILSLIINHFYMAVGLFLVVSISGCMTVTHRLIYTENKPPLQPPHTVNSI